MKKIWSKTGDDSYTFYLDSIAKGTLTIDFTSIDRKATVHFGENEYTIRLTGFWNNSFEIVDHKDKLIAKAYYEKWYANSMIFEYRNHHYKLVIRNNPLAEWAILEGDQTLLAYRLTADNGKAAVKISSGLTLNEELFDAVLWYLFIPIATENSDNTFLFLIA